MPRKISMATVYFFDEISNALGPEEAVAWLDNTLKLPRKPAGGGQREGMARDFTSAAEAKDGHMRECAPSLRFCSPGQNERLYVLVPKLKPGKDRNSEKQKRPYRIHEWHHAWTWSTDVEDGIVRVPSINPISAFNYGAERPHNSAKQQDVSRVKT